MATTRADRLAANRAAIAEKIGPASFVVRGVAEPRHPREHTPRDGRLRYVEVGQCAKCKTTWRTNLIDGAVKVHGAKGKPCTGSHKPPLAHTVVLKDLYKPGEPWPKKKT